ncbi:hypothetical protein XENOCAPTIV_022443 [Xenoophorus captivus]|uniref:Uncharacterized protein n=1 Tax=Xenoophorus captivus TaxID=1517983 RepID=A0ABV0R1N0_9TELE
MQGCIFERYEGVLGSNNQRCYLAVLSRGCWVPTSFLTCMATLLSSSLSRQRRLMNDVGYPTIFSASDTTLLHVEEDSELENRLRLLRPWTDTDSKRVRRDPGAGNITTSE